MPCAQSLRAVHIGPARPGSWQALGRGGQRVTRGGIAPQAVWPEAGQPRAVGMARGSGVRPSVVGGGDGGVPAGLGCLSVSFLISLYYNMVLTWVLWYLLNSFQQPLPWGTCPLDLNRTGDAGPGRRARLAPSLHDCSKATRFRPSSLRPVCLFTAEPGAHVRPVVHNAACGAGGRARPRC